MWQRQNMTNLLLPPPHYCSSPTVLEWLPGCFQSFSQSINVESPEKTKSCAEKHCTITNVLVAQSETGWSADVWLMRQSAFSVTASDWFPSYHSRFCSSCNYLSLSFPLCWSPKLSPLPQMSHLTALHRTPWSILLFHWKLKVWSHLVEPRWPPPKDP